MRSVYRVAFLCLAWGLAASIVVQVLLAGMAIFTHSSYWTQHRAFVHIFEGLPLLLLILAYVAKLPNRFRWEALALLLLVQMQYFTANFPGAGAFHPVGAMVLFWLALQIAIRSTQWYRVGAA